jgi:hypothetical protein
MNAMYIDSNDSVMSFNVYIMGYFDKSLTTK